MNSRLSEYCVTTCHRAATARAGLALMLAISILAVDAACATLNYSVGAKEVVYTSSQRKKTASNWPDGNFGIVANGNGTYDFYAANSSKSTKTTGTLTDPGKGKKSVKITGIPKKTFNYVAGGPIYKDPTSGARLMVYHAEKQFGSSKNYYSVLGLAISTDPSGLDFRDLGTIIEPNVAAKQLPHSIDIGGGSFAVVDGQLNVYYRDYMINGSSAELAVARAPLADVVGNALGGRGTEFQKYFNGSWSQQGRGGMASPLEIGNPANAWSSVSYNDYLNEVVMVSSQWTPEGSDLYMATSPDGVNWSARQPIAVDPGEQFYPSLIGTGADPARSGQSLYVYYTDSKKGNWGRWSDAQLARRMITFTSPASPPTPPAPVIVSTPPSFVPIPTMGGGSESVAWSTVGDYQSDFQPGGPAQGWQYAWTSEGGLGSQVAITPLVWSDAIQAYNTTGGALREPNGTLHNDDYLHLSASGGHPGRPAYYMPMAGYTIQEKDGAGFYRLADSSIGKRDGVASPGEDGLEVVVYLNNTFVGSTQGVSTDGLLASFDRNLGNLNVGDTVWIAINPLQNQTFDSFVNFDFSIQKAMPLPTLLQASAVPEPGAAVLIVLAIAMLGVRRRARNRRL